MPEGTVKFFNRAKGFGFIVPDDGGKEIFLPPAALGDTKPSPGQRVSFEVVPDAKGPKASALKILSEAPAKPQPAAPQPPRPQAPKAPAGICLFFDSATQDVDDIVEALEALGHQAQMIDVSVTPLTALQLRKWSQTLGTAGHGLVRRNTPLFFDLQLDDRFITEDEYWTAVILHPALLTGPILTARDRVRVCRTAQDVKAFFAGDDSAAPKSKEVSSRLIAMMRGEAVGPRPQPVAEEPEEAEEAEGADEVDEADEADAEAAPAPIAVKAKPAAKAAKPAAKKPAAKPVAKKVVVKAKKKAK